MTDTPAFKSCYLWKFKGEIDDVKERKERREGGMEEKNITSNL